MIRSIGWKSLFFSILTICAVYHDGQSESKRQQDSVPTLLKKYGCLSCHDSKRRLVGPSFNAIAKRKYSVERMAGLILKPEPANWSGYPAMPVIADLQKNDIEKVAAWINTVDASEKQ